jgi:hypothetical protein
MTAIYEIVTHAELKVGDVVLEDLHGQEYAILPSFFWDGIYEDDRILRRLPATDDPRVLRRALEVAAIDGPGNPEIETVHEQVFDWIEQARKELESEGGEG